jgi:DNA-binding transcriptional MerR regulator
MDDDGARLTIGHLSRATGLPVQTLRYWSDLGLVPPAGRAASGYRLYDTGSVARAELVRTLRELGLGLAEVRRVLEKETTVAEVAKAHVVALEAQIHTLRLRRAVLSTIAGRGSSPEEVAQMNEPAKLSVEERKRIVDDFLYEVFSGREAAEGMRSHLRQAIPELPEDPTPEQVDAWVELATLIQDPEFRGKVRALADYSTPRQTQYGEREEGTEDAVSFARRVVEYAGAARERGVTPESAEGKEILDRILGRALDPYRRAELREQLEIIADPRAERYWQLVGVINGWPPYPDRVPTLEHVVAGLRAHGWVAQALSAHG